MYLLSTEHFNKSKIPRVKKVAEAPIPKNQKPKRRVKQSLHPYDKWVKVRKNIREDEVRCNTQIKAIADILKILPSTTSLQTVSPKIESDT